VDDYKDYFAGTYEENRAKFRALIDPVRKIWPKATLEKQEVVAGEEDLTIDMIRALPEGGGRRILVLSSGLHGIEGYIGAAILQLFARECLSALDPEDTALVMVHAINPWGMKNRRRVNENNVDLNRNFIYDREFSGEEINPAYGEAIDFINPAAPLRMLNSPLFYFQLLYMIGRMGLSRFREMVLFGQYRFPEGLYYGGQGFERSAVIMNDLFKAILPGYKDIVYIDMHSGYGPRYQMTLVNSIHEKRDSGSLQDAFNYPLIAKTDRAEFYQMQGDMVDYLYQLKNDRFPDRRLYATSFEFGTYGESFGAVLKSYKAMINENRVFHHGAVNKKAGLRARRDFDELFDPQDDRWRIKALEDARRAFSGILQAEGFSGQSRARADCAGG
jgi:predicted deacylase